MVPTKQTEAVSRLRKFGPTAKVPTTAVQEALSASDRRLLQRRLTEAVECVFDPCFEEVGIGPTLLGPLSEAPGQGGTPGDPNSDDSGVDLLTTGRRSCSLTTELEQHLFRRLNYCRYRVMRVVKEHAGKRLSAGAVRELLKWEHATAQTREEIVRANVPLVLAMAKRARVTGVDFADLVSEGNLALLRSVDKFDCARGYKFSTYACRAILKSFSRVATRTARHRGHFPTEYDPALEKSNYVEQKRLNVEDDCVDELRSVLGSNLANLSEVERQVIRGRFALGAAQGDGDPNQGQTLEQVGVMIGVTKERVRQIQNKALTKLRHFLEGGILAR